jgi:signal transduction histidine kinase/CheY-like chemotaxis protein
MNEMINDFKHDFSPRKSDLIPQSAESDSTRYNSFNWTCNNLICNYQKFITTTTLLYSRPELDTIEQKIPSVLETLARFTSADHIAVCACTSNYKSIISYYEWNSIESDFVHSNSGKVTTANFLKYYFPVHSQGKEIYLKKTIQSKKELKPITDQMILNGIKSLICLPLVQNNSLIGIIEFYYTNQTTAFHERELNFLRYFAQLQSNVIQRIQQHKKWIEDADSYVSRQQKYEKELKESRKNAENAKKVKDTFFVNLSHEIRTPLNIISGMHRELMRENLNSRQKHFLQQSHVASNLLLNLFQNVMDINDLESNTFVLKQREFNVKQLLLEIKEMMACKINEKKSIDFQLIIADNLHGAYKGDDQRLQQILIKLISNAFKFTEQGVIRVEVNIRRKVTGYHELLFEISDSGIGMSKEYIGNVFVNFSQEDSSLNRLYRGAGMGLNICYRLVEHMGGSISFESEKGIGTLIHLTLPFALGDEKGMLEQLEQRSDFQFKNRKILLVEDNDTNRFIARQSLKITACDTYEATNGAEAVDFLRDHNVDIILMDIQMPVMNGIEATQLIRNELKLNTPIIAFTANAVDSEIAKYLSYGMDDFLVKPYHENELFEKINKLTQKYNMDTNSTEKLYDLSYLQELSQGDESFIRQIIETFLIMAEQSIDQLRVAQNENDVLAIRKIAHKIKPTLANFQANSIKTLIDKLNQAEPGSIEPEELRLDVEKVIRVLTTIQTQLKETLNN